MKSLRTMTEPEVCSAFIRAELDSSRFRDNMLAAAATFGVTEGQLRHPDTQNKQSAAQQRAVLVQARPGIMKTLPTDTVWQEALLSAEEWSRIQYINDEPWVVFSDETRLVSLGATKAIQQPERTIYQRMLEIQTKLRRGEKIEKIILLSDPKLSKLVLVEGHVRATSYLALGADTAKDIPVILGTSQHPETWSLY